MREPALPSRCPSLSPPQGGSCSFPSPHLAGSAPPPVPALLGATFSKVLTFCSSRIFHIYVDFLKYCAKIWFILITSFSGTHFYFVSLALAERVHLSPDQCESSCVLGKCRQVGRAGTGAEVGLDQLYPLSPLSPRQYPGK